MHKNLVIEALNSHNARENNKYKRFMWFNNVYIHGYDKDKVPL